MALFYIIYALNIAILLAVVATPVVLYFKNRDNTNFAPQIKIVAIVDAVYLALWILTSIKSGTLVQSASGVMLAILNIAGAIAILYCVWKMKDGKTFKSLFKNPGINSVLFVVYLLTNFVILYQLAITLFNYLFAGIAIIVVAWIANKFAWRDGKGLVSGGADGSCGSCALNNGQCALNPGSIPDPSNRSCPSYTPR